LGESLGLSQETVNAALLLFEVDSLSTPGGGSHLFEPLHLVAVHPDEIAHEDGQLAGRIDV
jgi:hypothetical protein